MRKLVFDDDRGYEAFQFLWMALCNSDLKLNNVTQLMALNTLSQKLADISKPDGGGRVLIKECELELTPDEQVLALTAFAHTNWKIEVYKNVRKACEFLGAEFEEVSRGFGDAQVH